jgi:hypothetical protein
MLVIEIDPNIRVEGNNTYSAFRNFHTNLVAIPGEIVLVVETESGLYGIAQVIRVDYTKNLVYLRVDWHKLQHSDYIVEYKDID